MPTAQGSQIAFTAVPNGFTKDSRLKIAVLITPKLTGTLGLAFQNWPTWVENHNLFTITLGTLKNYPDTPCTNKLLPDLWTRLFYQTNLIDFKSRTENITSYRSERLANCVRQSIQLFGRHFGTQTPADLKGGYDKSKYDGTIYGPFAKDHALYKPDAATAPAVPPPAPHRDIYRMTGVLPATTVQPPLTKSAQDTLDSYIHGTPEPANPHPLVDLHRFIGRVQRRTDTVDPKSIQNSNLDLTAVDFHRRLSLLSHHPSLLRALGLVLDFEVDNPVSSAVDVDIDLTVSPQGLSDYGQVIGITKASVSTNNFSPRNNPNPDPNDPTAYLVQDGCIVLDSKFALESLDIESAALHLASHANQHHKLLNQKSSTNAGQEVHTPLPAPPSVATTGLALYRRDRKSASDHLGRLAQQQMSTMSPIFYAESLLQGFAVDLCDASGATRIWYHATQKTEFFEFGSTGIGAGDLWEAAQRTGGVRPNDKTPSDQSSGGDVCVSDRIFTWRGFSFIAGSTEDKKQKVKDPGPAKPKVSAWKGIFSKREILPAEGTKENDKGWSRVHFLRKYQVSMRPVYVTGDSPTFVEANSVNHLWPSSPMALLRFERVPPPRLLLASPLNPKSHEKLSVIVLRSYLDDQLKFTNLFEGSRTRYLIPAAAPIDLVRTHSDLKQADRIDRGFRRLGFDDRGNINEVICSPKDCPNHTDQRYRPDPLCKSAILHLSTLTGEDLGSQTITFYSNDGDEQWPDCFLNQIEFKGTKSGQPSIEKPTKDADATFGTTGSSQRVRIKIPAGWTILLHISTLLDDKDLEMMAIVPDCVPPSSALIPLAESNIHQGLHPMLTPAHVVRIYHAVDRPLQQPDFQFANQPPQTSPSALSKVSTAPLPTTRELEDPSKNLPKIHRVPNGPISPVAVTFILPCPSDGQTNGIIFKPSYDQKSTGKLQLSASFSEWVDEPGSGKVPFLRNQHSVVYENSISTRRTLNHGPKDVSIVHSLPDSKYYRVRYEMRCSSRYAELYDQGPAANFQAPAAQHSFDVLATREPDPPKFLYVLPNFGWRKFSSDSDQKTNGSSSAKKQSFWEHTRSCGIRVFLGRPWFSSGDDELLGVLVMLSPDVIDQMKARRSVNVANTGFGADLQNAITRWGGDPIWNRVNATPIPLVLSEWQLKNTKDPVSAVQLDPSLRFQPTVLGACGWGLKTPELLESQSSDLVGVVGYRPIYDEVSGNYYCDIAFDSKPLYATFLRMALVRYQPHAVPGKELSKIFLADFALLNADRTVRVAPHGWRSFSVELHGLKNTGGKNPGDGTAYRVTIEKRRRQEGDMSSFEELEVQSDPNDPAYHSDPSLLWRGTVSKACICSGNRLVVREYEVSQKSGMRQVYADALKFD